jgi:hypothetical protein
MRRRADVVVCHALPLFSDATFVTTSPTDHVQELFLAERKAYELKGEAANFLRIRVESWNAGREGKGR